MFSGESSKVMVKSKWEAKHRPSRTVYRVKREKKQPIELILALGGCSWSQVKNCSCGKGFIPTHSGKIGSISPNALNQNSISTQNHQNQSCHYVKRDSKVRRSTNLVIIEDSKNSEGSSTSFSRPIVVGSNIQTYVIPRENIMGIKLYSASDSPPSLVVQMALKYLRIDYELVNVDFIGGEHHKPEYLEKNPQGEIPVLDDNGFFLSESVAILLYLVEKYKKDETFYPTDSKERAIVNHRLVFHLTTLYDRIMNYSLLPCFYAYTKTEENLKKFLHALKVFEEYMKRTSGAYVTGANLTVCDLPLIMDLACIEAMEDYELTLSPFPLVKKWYEGFKVNQPDLWIIVNQGLVELNEFSKNPPDLSHIKHPIHPTDKTKLK